MADHILSSDARLTDARTPTVHSHAVADVTGLQTSLDAKVAASVGVVTTDPRLSDARTPTAHTHSYASLTSIPSTFAPSAHASAHLAGGSDAIGGLPICDTTVSTAQTIGANQRCVTFGLITVNALVTVNGLWTALSQVQGI